MKTKTKIWLGVIGIGIVLGVYFLIAQAAKGEAACMTKPANELFYSGEQNWVFHIHPTLTITINGEAYNIPQGIGHGGGLMQPLHTHDATGKVHVESLCYRDYTLGDFFDVWGQTFTSTCIFSSCVDETHTLKLVVNGVESTAFRDLVLNDGDAIEIVYEEV